jgi:magnesium-transporting ATPase (P-type)
MTGHIAVLFLSVLLWWLTAFVITNAMVFDYNWYQIWPRLMRSGNFWLGLLVLVTIIAVKDIARAVIRRTDFYTNDDIVQEVNTIVWWHMMVIKILRVIGIAIDGLLAHCRCRKGGWTVV